MNLFSFIFVLLFLFSSYNRITKLNVFQFLALKFLNIVSADCSTFDFTVYSGDNRNCSMFFLQRQEDYRKKVLSMVYFNKVFNHISFINNYKFYVPDMTSMTKKNQKCDLFCPNVNFHDQYLNHEI